MDQSFFNEHRNAQVTVCSVFDVYEYGFVVADLNTGNLIMIGGEREIALDKERMDRIIASEKIAPFARRLGIPRANDILWYYAFSREKALDISAGSEPSLDTNLVPEVRLAGLRKTQTGSSDPYQFAWYKQKS